MSEVEERTGFIDNFLESNWRNFVEQCQPSQPPSVEIPTQFQSVLIPRRILEVVSDPTAVSVFGSFPRARWLDSSLKFAIAEEGGIYGHAGIDDVVKGGDIELPLGAKPLIYYSMSVVKGYPDTAYEDFLNDRPVLQGIGIGTSFYGRLEAVLRHLGFKYLAGDIVSGHPRFFERDRIAFGELPPILQKEIPVQFTEDEKGEGVFVKIL